jgi:hypothetical protein
MINNRDDPVAWILMVDQLTDAHEHLGGLVKKITSDPTYDEESYAIDLGHVMAHLNRAWASRNVRRELTNQEWEDFREFPSDLRPIA